MWKLIFAIALALPVSGAFAKYPTTEESAARFELYTRCIAVSLVVEGLSADAARIGLRKNEIAPAVRSRFRVAQLYDAENTESFLHVNTHVLNPNHS